MIEEIIEEAIDLFGGMKPREIIREVLPAAACFISLWALVVLSIVAFG